MIVGNEERRGGARDGFDYHDRIHRPAEMENHGVPADLARSASMIDIDSAEYCHLCSEVIFLAEVKQKEEQQKFWKVTRRLARKAGVPAYLIVHEESEVQVEATDGWIGVFMVGAFYRWLFEQRMEHLLNDCVRKGSDPALIEAARIAAFLGR